MQLQVCYWKNLQNKAKKKAKSYDFAPLALTVLLELSSTLFTSNQPLCGVYDEVVAVLIESAGVSFIKFSKVGS